MNYPPGNRNYSLFFIFVGDVLNVFREWITGSVFLFLAAEATAMFMGLCAAAFLPAFGIGVYVKQPSTIAAIANMVSGAVIWFLWTAFVHTAEVKTARALPGDLW